MLTDFSGAAEFLRNCRDAVIITHRNPDGDCIGAGFAMKDILASLGIRSRVVCHDDFPHRFDFITGIGAGEDFEPQSVIAVDLADVQLMGSLGELYGDKVQLCIDHHVSNKDYAQLTPSEPMLPLRARSSTSLQGTWGLNSQNTALPVFIRESLPIRAVSSTAAQHRKLISSPLNL